MEKTKGVDNAFPVKRSELSPFGGMVDVTYEGLTKREYFAAMANTTEVWGESGWSAEFATEVTGVELPKDNKDQKAWHLFWITVEAVLKVQKADALITALNKPI